jgi:hypothetical protein
MKITKAIHVTATEKRHLKAFLASGMTQSKVNTKTYQIINGKPLMDGKWEHEIRIITPQRNDIGEKTFDKQTITIEI